MAEDTRPAPDPDLTPAWPRPAASAAPPTPGPIVGPAPAAAWWTRPPPAERTAAPAPGSGLPDRRSIRHAVNASGRRRALIILGILGGAPLLAALGLVALLPDPPPDSRAEIIPARAEHTAASRSTRSGPATPSATASRSPQEPVDLAVVTSDTATTDLGLAGVDVRGTVDTAWEWTGTRGRSLVAAVTEVISRADDGSTTKAALRIHYVTGLDGKPRVRRTVKDTSVGCSDGGTVDTAFTPAAFGVRDLNGDGSPEITIGWTARCGDPTATSRVRLAVISGTKLYTLRGVGVVTGAGATDPATGADPAGGGAGGDAGAGVAPSPVPAASTWPAQVLDAARATFHHVYY